MFENETYYVPYRLVRHIIKLISVVSISVLCFMKYNAEYKCIILLPLVYLVVMHHCIKWNSLKGIGSIMLVVIYGFRMCILPILCAYGNFYIEPDKSIYISYFFMAVLLMCFECVIVFVSYSYYSKIYRNKIVNCNETNLEDNSLVKSILIIALIVYIIIACTHSGFLNQHYHFLLSSEEQANAFEIGNAALESIGFAYYFAVIIEITIKPIFVFTVVNWSLKKYKWWSIPLAVLIGIGNMLWITDRRILSFLIGVCCLVQVLLFVRNKMSKYTLYWLVAFLGLLTIVYCFLGEDTPIRIARKFQRYFSGPSLTAIGISVYNSYIQTPIQFAKLLFNDSLVLTGLFGPFEVKGYVMELCGQSGYSIWTPMFIGAIQYFHIFAPILIMLPVKFLVYMDYRSLATTSNLKKMMCNYLTISTAIYMVMYSIELVYYNVVFIGGTYFLLLLINKKIKIRI